MPRWVSRLSMQVVLISASGIALLPIYFMVVSSLKQREEYLADTWGLPEGLYLENFLTSLGQEATAGRFLNSIILTVGSVAISTLLASLAAFAFARLRVPGKRTLFNFILALMVVPPVVMVVPLFVTMASLKLVNTYQGVILIYVGLLLPFSIYLLSNFFETIPGAIVDAARIDGCSNLGVFWRIMLPLSAPALITLVVVNAMWVWNELLIALVFLQRDELKTVMVGVSAMRSRYYLDIPATMAGLLIATLPIVLLYLFGQRFFIRGLVSGAVK